VQQATLILDNYQQLGRQPTAHGNKIMFFSFPKFNKSNKGEDNYEMLVERQSQELYEIVTNKNEVYQWEVLTGRLLSCTIDDNLHLKKMKTSQNMPQHFSSFSVGVVVKDTDTEVLEYEEKGFEETLGAEDNTIFMVTIDKQNEKMQKKLTMAEKTKTGKTKPDKSKPDQSKTARANPDQCKPEKGKPDKTKPDILIGQRLDFDRHLAVRFLCDKDTSLALQFTGTPFHQEYLLARDSIAVAKSKPANPPASTP
jgi:succinate dehydrogenase flavin-adding protein (antitoxin of CptAB toxin-antitoxin module)